MLLNLISFLSLLIVLYLAILYMSTSACALFFLLGITLILSLLQLICTARSLNLYLPEVILNTPGEERATFSVVVKNNGCFTISHAKIKLSLLNITGKKVKSIDLDFSADSQKHMVIPVEISNTYCGIFKIQIEYLRIYSMFSLLNKNLHPKIHASVLFYPKFHALPVTVSEVTRYACAESDGFDEVIPGIPHVPMNQIRHFQPGDRMHQIHWKLSARTDEILVRNAGRPEGFPVLLFLLQKPSFHKNDAVRYSCFLEYAASLSFSLLEVKCSHFVVWYDSNEQTLIRFPVRTDEELNTCIYYLLHARIQTLENDLYQLYFRKYPSDTCQTKLTLDTNLILCKDQEPLLSCTENNWLEHALNYALIV